MKTINSLPAFLGMALIFLASCGQHSSNKCLPCPLPAQLPPGLTFRVVDKTTGKDLFFGADAKYTPGQLKVHHIVNALPDTAFLQIDTPNMTFKVHIIPLHQTDTVTMNIADQPQDVLLFNRTNSGGCCAVTYLSSITYNGIVVYNSKNVSTEVAVLRK